MTKKTTKRGPIDAVTLIADLTRNPDYQKRLRDREARETENRKTNQNEQALLIRDLQQVGINVSSIWDLVKSSTPYTPALPILIKHLKRPYSPKLREGVARALAVRESRFAWDDLTRTFEVLSKPTEQTVKFAVGLALSASVTPDVTRELIELVSNRSHGPSRLALLLGLRKQPSPEARAAIEQLRDDPDLCKEIASWSKRMPT